MTNELKELADDLTYALQCAEEHGLHIGELKRAVTTVKKLAGSNDRHPICAADGCELLIKRKDETKQLVDDAAKAWLARMAKLPILPVNVYEAFKAGATWADSSAFIPTH